MSEFDVLDTKGLNQKITLRTARIANGMTEEDVSHRMDLPIEELMSYEVDSSSLPIGIAQRLLDLYKVKFGAVYFGSEVDVES